jgi:hypothetical protein
MEKIDHMKPFQPRTLEQQRKNYVKACKRSMTQELNGLTYKYRHAHDTLHKLYFNRSRLVDRADRIQARVANAADKEFGGWDTWRHDQALLTVVVGRMDEAVRDLNEKIELIDLRIEATMRGYHRERKAVANKYHALIKTA